ncbi:RHS repeat domain-containing protein, partial [Neisseria sp. 83E34]|uniref:RHS repeat domain-containing protein n=1 Tax=Neisseria sp. 83E34 TaxID=1692264 RepID=UPI000B1B80EC
FDNHKDRQQYLFYFHNNQIGTPHEMTDIHGNLLWYGSYSAWGSLASEKRIYENVHQPFRLQNQYFDAETGLHYNFFRYYEAETGRFTNQDPIGLVGGDNLYWFAPNIQNWIDFLGLQSWPTPPSNIPGGPWTPATGQRPGSYNGTNPPGTKGSRPFCQYVPPEGTGPKGGMPGAKQGYFKVKNQNGKGWQRYDLKGRPITAEQAHPGNSQNNRSMRVVTPSVLPKSFLFGLGLLLTPSQISKCQDLQYSLEAEECNKRK